MKHAAWIGLVFGVWAMAAQAQDAAQPVVSDSRVKTFVYNENDVYNIQTYYGYQSNVEFGPQEAIETISLGDRVGWQVVPAGRRLFIRALEENAHTNMTVVTNRHAYQFDLTAKPPRSAGAELAYVARFYYPQDEKLSPEMMSAAGSEDLEALGTQYNYRYTYSGPETAAPTKIFDDGRLTYMKFRDTSGSMTVSVVGSNGIERPLTPAIKGEYVTVSVVASRFTVRRGGNIICIFNESAPHASAQR